MTTRENTFFMVQGDDPAIMRHSTKASAESEAMRLARMNPGHQFYVMMAIGGFIKDEVRPIEIIIPEDAHPKFVPF